MASLSGVAIGILFSTWNADQIGWALLRMTVLGVVFGWAARTIATNLMRAWLEGRLKEAEIEKRQKAEEARKMLEEKIEAKKKKALEEKAALEAEQNLSPKDAAEKL